MGLGRRARGSWESWEIWCEEPFVFFVLRTPAISRPEEEKKDTERMVITAQDIKKMNVRTIVELLNHIPGVHATESSVSLRGSCMDRALETLLESWSVKQDLKSPIPIGRYGSINTWLDFEIAQVSGSKAKSKQEEKYGLYASKEIPLGGPPIKLRLGLRWNVYSEFDPAENPEVRLAYDRANFILQLAGIRTSNTPTFLQRYYESSTTVPNPDLGMEKTMNYSLSLWYHPKKSVMSLFY